MLIQKKMITAAFCGLLFAAALDVSAQFPGFNLHSGKKRGKNQPTEVKAESMDIDMNNNKVTLIGNVDVDDQDMNIKCRKMILHFMDTEKKDAKDKKDTSSAEGATGSKKIEKVECFGDVEITRSTGTGKDRQLQKAYAGKAVYSLVNSKITLTEKPVVTSSGSILRGEFITIDTQSGRISVLRPDSRIIGGLKGAAAPASK